jgi:fructuronate reductase
VTVARRTAPAPPVRAVHLGLGNFFRAHQAWYTDRAGDDWGIAAFTGRRPDLARALAAQDGLYTLVTRGADGDRFDVVRSVVRAHAADEHDAWLCYLASPDVRLVTVTVTEAGYRPDVAPARLLAGLRARRAADAGPLTVVPCDNLPQNGAVLARALRGLAESVDPSLAAWLDEQVSVVTTMVDRITPEPTAADRAAVLAGTGIDDRCPVATEPFSEWVLAGDFPGGRPAWETAGAVFAPDVTPFEERKLWLLNGAHSLLAYVGPLRGATTVDEALRDDRCVELLHSWWATCLPHLPDGGPATEAYCTALLDRFANPRMRHSLAQIAADGSQKLPVRILPVLRRERAAGRLPDTVVTLLAAWVLHLRGAGVPVQDVRAEVLRPAAARPLRDAVPAVLDVLDPGLADDAELVAAVVAGAAAGQSSTTSSSAGAMIRPV